MLLTILARLCSSAAAPASSALTSAIDFAARLCRSKPLASATAPAARASCCCAASASTLLQRCCAALATGDAPFLAISPAPFLAVDPLPAGFATAFAFGKAGACPCPPDDVAPPLLLVGMLPLRRRDGGVKGP